MNDKLRSHHELLLRRKQTCSSGNNPECERLNNEVYSSSSQILTSACLQKPVDERFKVVCSELKAAELFSSLNRRARMTRVVVREDLINQIDIIAMQTGTEGSGKGM